MLVTELKSQHWTHVAWLKESCIHLYSAEMATWASVNTGIERFIICHKHVCHMWHTQRNLNSHVQIIIPASMET